MERYQSSSPDPLGLSPADLHTLPARHPRPSISPRKPLSDASGNARTQEFYISTPPAKRRSDSGKSFSQYQQEPESPWRIRLTVEAERVDGEFDPSDTGKILQATTTTTIPLKGGDDDSPPIKRGRGRPRKSLEARSGNGTPGPKSNLFSNRQWNVDSSSVVDTWAPTPPQKAQKGRPRKRNSNNQSFATDGTSPASAISSPRRATPERTVKARPFSRSRSRSRRKEITPRKLGSSIVLEHDDTSELEKQSSPSIVGSHMEQTSQSSITGHEGVTSHTSSPAIADQHASSLDRSTEDFEDEKMWRAMIQKDSVSPSLPNRLNSDPDPNKDDPTEEHQDFDTILESEGFSMVSVESLQSTSSGPVQASSEKDSSGLQYSRMSQASPSERSLPSKSQSTPGVNGDLANNGDTSLLRPAHAYSTPQVQDKSPSMPPTPQQIFGQRQSPKLPVVDGTPQSERVTRASIKLQALPSPQAVSRSHEASSLASPFDARKKDGGDQDPERQDLTPLQPQMSNADLVCGFSPATRRELKAGLRLGEELAKRYKSSPMPADASGPAIQQVNRRVVSTDTDTSMWSNPQLPSPVTSTKSGGDEQMSWRVEAPEDLAPGQTRQALAGHAAEEPEVDYSMLAREAEWQREREAVSRQIREANSSQVIVIEDTEITSPVSSHGDAQTAQDISTSGSSSSTVQDRISVHETPERSESSEFAPFRRSKLPSPWLRNASPKVRSQEVTTSPSRSDLFWQPDSAHVEANNRRIARRKQREDSQNSSHLTVSSIQTESSDQRSTRSSDSTSLATKVDPTLGQDITASFSEFEPSSQTSVISDSLNGNLSRIQPAGQLLAEGGSRANLDSYLTNQANIESSSVLLGDDVHYPTLNSFEANREKYLPLELLQPVEDSLAVNRPNIQSDLITELDDSIVQSPHHVDREDTVESDCETEVAEESTVALAEDVPPSIVPLLGSPSLNALDPELLADTSEYEDDVDAVTLMMSKAQITTNSPQTHEPTTKAQPTSSWWSAITAPLTSLISGPSCPAATKEDILVSSPHEPLPWFLPTTPAHLRALQPLVWSSTLYNPAIFPFNSSSPCRYVLGATISTGRGWAREITKADCGIIDAFRVLLRYRGIIPEEGRGLIEGERLTCRHIAAMIVRIWVQMVMEGYVDHREWKGVRTGMNVRGDAKWNERDIVIDEANMDFVQMRRRIFTEEGLPSWKARGWKGPFALAKPL